MVPSKLACCGKPLPWHDINLSLNLNLNQSFKRHNLVCSPWQTSMVRGANANRRVLPTRAFDEYRAHLSEALDIYRQASTLAQLQTQHELEQAFLADLELTAATAPPQSSPRRAMLSFWCEQGLSSAVSEQLVRRIDESGRTYSVQQLEAKVQRLNRILPDVDVALLASRDLAVLDIDPGLAIRNMVVLVEAFPGKQVAELVQRQPRLLTCTDLPERKERVLAQLTVLHPSRERKVVASVVGEYPDLLFRMDYYTHVRMIDELPIEIQNMFVLADQGIGFLHRYYKRAKNNFIADTSDEEAGF